MPRITAERLRVVVPLHCIHDDLLGIEDANPIDAVALYVPYRGAMVGEALIEFDKFAGEHNWRNSAQVFQALHLAQWCRAKVQEATRPRRTHLTDWPYL